MEMVEMVRGTVFQVEPDEGYGFARVHRKDMTIARFKLDGGRQTRVTDNGRIVLSDEPNRRLPENGTILMFPADDIDLPQGSSGDIPTCSTFRHWAFPPVPAKLTDSAVERLLAPKRRKAKPTWRNVPVSRR